MVIKTVEQTLLSALFYGHLAKQAGIPDGSIILVTGLGESVGASIRSHMDIGHVIFTGSMEVGQLIMQVAALSNLKNVSLELGGKSRLIVFNDIDVDKATDLAFLEIVMNKGGIYEQVVEKLIEMSKSWVVVDPFDPITRN